LKHNKEEAVDIRRQIVLQTHREREVCADIVQVGSYGALGMLNWLYKSHDPEGWLSVPEAAGLPTMRLPHWVALGKARK
jgi:hypothetical protein